MKDRLLTLACALGALLLSVFLLAPPGESEDKPISVPTTEDSGSNGLKGLYQWLVINKIPVQTLRKRFTDLMNDQNLSPQGNLLIISMPQQREILDSEWRALRRWIDQGNKALILGAAYSRPAWADNSSCFCDVKKLLSGFGWKIKADQGQNKKTSDSSQPEKNKASGSFKTHLDSFKSHLKALEAIDIKLLPQSSIPVMHNVTEVASKILPASLDQDWLLKAESKQLALRLLTVNDGNDSTLMWQIEAGNGQIFLALVADLFDNSTLNEADNALFFANILAQGLNRKGRVIFDDYHFGLSELYDPERFFNDSRLYQTLGFIFLFWLLYVMGYSNRLAPVKMKPVQPSARDFVDAMAGFFARRLDKKTVAQELSRRLIQDIRRQRKLQDESVVWEWLHSHPQLSNIQLNILLQAEQKQCSRLELLTNTITDIRKKIFL